MESIGPEGFGQIPLEESLTPTRTKVTVKGREMLQSDMNGSYFDGTQEQWDMIVRFLESLAERAKVNGGLEPMRIASTVSLPGDPKRSSRLIQAFITLGEPVSQDFPPTGW
jgi:hypothetical protein